MNKHSIQEFHEKINKLRYSWVKIEFRANHKHVTGPLIRYLDNVRFEINIHNREIIISFNKDLWYFAFLIIHTEFKDLTKFGFLWNSGIKSDVIFNSVNIYSNQTLFDSVLLDDNIFIIKLYSDKAIERERSCIFYKEHYENDEEELNKIISQWHDNNDVELI